MKRISVKKESHDPKNYFHLAEPFCEDYLKMKQASFENILKIRAKQDKDK